MGERPVAADGARLIRALFVAAALMACAAPALAQSPRVDLGARAILDHRLTTDNVRRVSDVMRAMDAVPVRGPEAPRDDVAMIVVLSMAWAYHHPWTDRTVDEAVRTTSRHADLMTAIQGAGLSGREYVLTTMNLMLAHPIVMLRRQGRAAPVNDVAPDNVAFVERYWGDVDRLMTELQARVAAARR